ncbi:Threonyl-tRNA synthetase [hydrothermal vent metagenome]|uniref:threonine--tRNA ligase n=1 Tax=hydrothermal vent metagenome TaxID=652676 RepID=A0A3B0Z8C2_9ZZZZ
MPQITLPDGSQRQFENPVSIYDVAADIGPGLAKAALAGKVDGVMVDTSFIIENDAELAIITDKDEEALEVIRHSTAHLLAQAVKELFPEIQVTIGPVIENGFYYDFAYEGAFSEDDLKKIEKKMSELTRANHSVTRSVMPRDEAVKFFKDMGEEFKALIIADIPSNEDISLYKQGDFIDLCRGPHVPSTGKLKAFKLTKVAGAYWRGDANNQMLQRVYGTAWQDKKALKAYLNRIVEAEKRDHRKLAKKLDLFHIQEEAPGMIFWHEKGWAIVREIKNYIRHKLSRHGYQEINTPQVVDRTLWEKSGHWSKFKEDMFTVHAEHHEYAVKPMNCPCHVQIFNQGLKSYRDLPLRMAEFGSCHRNEPSGTLHGLMRLRSFVQDDAHIFCTEESIQDEVSSFIDLLYEVYADFGFAEILIKLSTRPAKRVGSDEEWDKSEKALEQALDAKELDWELQPGEGAFYGPKIEFSLKDCLERVWQCGTIQVDFSTPGRLDAQYVTEDGSRKVPVMLHRAILGSLERFIGILIEQHAGALPTWLSPIQAVLLNITDKHREYTQKVEEILRNKGFKVNSDLRNEKIGFKIREHILQKVPYLLSIGDREVESGSVSVRKRGSKESNVMTVEQFADLLTDDIAHHG